MYVAVTVVHIVACVFLIGVVLLQQGKGADMGAVFGGSSQTVFGSSGAGNFLTRLTTGMAVVFMITSLTLAYGSARRVTSTVFDDAPLPESAPLDTGAPAAQPAPEAAAPSADTSKVVQEGAEGEASTVVEVQGNAQAAVEAASDTAGETAQKAAGSARQAADAAAERVEAGAERAAEEVEDAAQAAEQKAEEAADDMVGAEVGEAPGEADPVPPAVP